MTDEPTLADVKALLAAHDTTVQPGARLTTYAKPTGPAAVVVLERVRAGYTPDYCVHGFASCVSCEAMCYLGSETHKHVSARKAYPICKQCADKIVPPSMRDGGHHVETLEDHKRKDGPH